MKNVNKVHLSKRLTAVADFVPENGRVADIGSDHALVPLSLVASGKITFAIAGEVIAGPFHRAQNAIAAAGLTPNIQTRLADGLAAIQTTDQIDTVVIAGMGGQLISDILTRGEKALKTVKTLILEANIQEALVREWLMQHNYQIVAETILAEDNHIYEIIKATKVTVAPSYTQQQLIFGPLLMQQQAAVFKQKWQHRALTNQRIITNLKANAHSDKSAKLRSLELENQQIKEVLA
ncbi:tRNA (adenine(22)-N(1))-methyltransferase [Loigolactobacillus backii]|uniref:tRNA (adenine(22)-N(1))-methyltransferase n=1 Tax=Loigolactobacillus backii TaxID=375175 RepID=UPI00384C7993